MWLKLQFFFTHYVCLLIFLLACFGFGTAMGGGLLRTLVKEGWLRVPLTIALGIGLFIFILQILGIAGLLRPAAVLSATAAGIVITAANLRCRCQRRHSDHTPATPQRSLSELIIHFAPAILVILAVATQIFSPLGPTVEWDDSMYHLPHAQEWAQAGKLIVNERLRYPWFPFNYNLLYAAALLVQDDVLAHLLHAVAGWLIAFMLLGLGERCLNRFTGCLAALVWLLELSRTEYGNALIDMGVTLFVLTTCVLFWLWVENRKSTRLLFLAAFALGTAAGAKYQVLFLFPFFGISLLLFTRNLQPIAVALCGLLLPCIYWYARNAIVTGDPFNPLGGPIFGFYDWSAQDLEYQLEDLKRASGWPSPMLWPALAAPLIPRLLKNPPVRACMFFCVWAVLVWMVTSHFPRYLMAAFPLIALLCAAVCFQLVHFAGTQITKMLALHHLVILRFCALTAILFVLTMSRFSFRTAHENWHLYQADPAAREAILHQRVVGYSLLQDLKNLGFKKIYNNGLEGSLYYSTQPLYGDHFGEWRYREYLWMPAEQVAQRLRDSGFDAIVVNMQLSPDFPEQPGFECHFTLVKEGDRAALFAVRKEPCRNDVHH